MMQLHQEFATDGMGPDRHFAWQQSSGPNVRFGVNSANQPDFLPLKLAAGGAASCTCNQRPFSQASLAL
jgi:hypothetical protein